MCTKTETGHCQGCELFRVGMSMIQNTVPYQEVASVIWEKECPPDQKPKIDDAHGETGLISLTIEGEKLDRR